MNVTIRTRLTIWYTSLLVLTLLLLGSLTYAGLWWLIRTDADEVLRTKFQSVSAEVEHEDGVLGSMSSAPRPATQGSRPVWISCWSSMRTAGRRRLRRAVCLRWPQLREALAGRETWGSFQLDGSTFGRYRPVGRGGQDHRCRPGWKIRIKHRWSPGLRATGWRGGNVDWSRASLVRWLLYRRWPGTRARGAHLGGARRPSMLRGCLDVSGPLTQRISSRALCAPSMA